ncbi:MAG: type Z 30S ribosomal protein S14 [Candidatus Sericytochromatia bacterium]|nr:type Z 30S ribosomal protein S14 [Candidatus Sericytochromatia bacterium]
MAKKSMIIKAARATGCQIRIRCRTCGRPRAVYRKFGLCRVCFRNAAHRGELPGVVKSSW